MSGSALPSPSASQAYFTLSTLEAGQIHLPERLYVADADQTIVRRCPTLSFFLRHSKTGKLVVFDLGLRKDLKIAPSSMQWVRESGVILEVPQDVAESLQNGGVQPEDIDYVICSSCLFRSQFIANMLISYFFVVSHIHFDHTGDATPFTQAKFLLGAASEPLVKASFPANPDSSYLEDTVPLDRTEFLNPTNWVPLGPFPRTLDYFGDGSLYLVDAPGHILGHLNALVRVGTGTNDWVLLAGDTAHDLRLLDGVCQICVYHDGSSAHVDRTVAEEHIKRVRALRDEYGVEVVLAHAYRWDQERQHTYFPSSFRA